MIKGSVGRRYAKALFELLDAPSVEPARAGLAGLGRALSESAPLKHVVVSPAFSTDEKLAVLTALSERFGCPPVINGFLVQLARRNRVVFLPEIAEALAALADQAKGTRQVMVTSAKALTKAEQDGLSRRLRDLFQRDVALTFQTEPHLLAGLRIRIGSTVVDSSVQGRLAAMKSVLTKE